MISIKVDATATRSALRSLFADQLPFATMRAINETAKQFQEEQRRGMQQRFTVRRPQFVLRAVKISPFATKQRLEARIAIDPPGGQARADILTKFEEGGTKTPRTGARIAIPDQARRTKAGVVSRTQRPSAFDFQPHGTFVFSRSARVMVGKRRTVLIRQPGGRGVILQRVGRGRASELRALYVFRPHVPIDQLLEFEETAFRVVRERWSENFEAAFARAIATAK